MHGLDTWEIVGLEPESGTMAADNCRILALVRARRWFAGDSSGRRISVRSSSVPKKLVMSAPTKYSFGRKLRCPRRLTMTNSASERCRHNRNSEAGSACAMLPQKVPRERDPRRARCATGAKARTVRHR